MSSVVCPVPTAHSGTDALNMYKKKQKEMPGLTPAAWRKAAAQEMGLDYNTYLSLWKQGKAVAKTAKMVPASTPTLEAAAGPGPTMKIPMKKAPKTMIQELADFNESITGAKKAYINGEIDFSDLDDILGDMKTEWKGVVPDDIIQNNIKVALNDMQAVEDKLLGTATAAEEVGVATEVKSAQAVDDYVQTHLGPLNHDLAQQVYKKMKIDMPGATPATLRHAAADYLKVPYDDYLAAWKKPGTTTAKAAKLPSTTDVPLSPSKTGKYSKVDIAPDELKNELAALYGPGGNPNYISFLEHDQAAGTYKFEMPKGLIKNSAQRKQIVQGLKDLGLEVDESAIGWNRLTVKSPAHKAPPPPEPLNLVNPYNVTVYHDGTTVLDIPSGNSWTKAWWDTISSEARKGVKRYTTNAYRKINTALRKGGKLSGDMKAMSDAMPYTTKQFTVFRGCGDEVGRSLTIDAFKQGKLFEDLGFMSTAVTPESAWRGVKLVIDLPPGTKGMYIDYVSSARGEMEFLLDAGTQFRVKSVETVPGGGPRSGTVHLVAIPKKKV